MEHGKTSILYNMQYTTKYWSSAPLEFPYYSRIRGRGLVWSNSWNSIWWSSYFYIKLKIISEIKKENGKKLPLLVTITMSTKRHLSTKCVWLPVLWRCAIPRVIERHVHATTFWQSLDNLFIHHVYAFTCLHHVYHVFRTNFSVPSCLRCASAHWSRLSVTRGENKGRLNLQSWKKGDKAREWTWQGRIHHQHSWLPSPFITSLGKRKVHLAKTHIPGLEMWR